MPVARSPLPEANPPPARAVCGRGAVLAYPARGMLSLLAAFQSTLRRQPNRLALIARSGGVAWSFADLERLVDERARELASLEPGPIALALRARTNFVVDTLACWHAGRVAIPLDATLDGAGLAHLAGRLGARFLFHDPAGTTVAQDVVPAVELPAGTALVKVTSGSTGEPVGVVLSEAALLAGIEHIARGMRIDHHDVILVPLPLSHSYGFDSGVLSLAVLGTPLVVENALYPTSILTALRDTEATVLLLVPPLVRALAELTWPPQHRLRLVISAGGPLDPTFGEKFATASGVAVSQFYGSTETGGITFESCPDAPEAAGAVGSPLPGVQVELGEDGRVQVASPALASAFVSAGALLPCDASITTGDTAIWRDGRLCLTGRIAGLLNIAGRKVQIAGVEKLLAALPGVREVAIVGIPESVRGDRIVVFAVTDGRTLDPRDLPFGVLAREIHYLDSLPFTERGKVDRRRLRELAEAQHQP